MRALDRRERGPGPLTRALPQGHGLLSERAHQRCCPLCEEGRLLGWGCRRRGCLVWRPLCECVEPELGQVSHPECPEHVSGSCHFRLSICVSAAPSSFVLSVYVRFDLCPALSGTEDKPGKPQAIEGYDASLPAPRQAQGLSARLPGGHGFREAKGLSCP